MFEQTNGHDTEVVRSFKYLGTVINNSNDRTEELSKVMHTGPKNTRMEEASLGKRRMEAPFEGGQSPGGPVAPHMVGWKQTGCEACTKEMRKSTECYSEKQWS
jgi:hypothetical protein